MNNNQRDKEASPVSILQTYIEGDHFLMRLGAAENTIDRVD